MPFAPGVLGNQIVGLHMVALISGQNSGPCDMGTSASIDKVLEKKFCSKGQYEIQMGNMGLLTNPVGRASLLT